MTDDPAYAEPLPAVEFLDTASRANGFEDWFSVPTFLRTPLNRKIIVEARVLAKGGYYVPSPPNPSAPRMRDPDYWPVGLRRQIEAVVGARAAYQLLSEAEGPLRADELQHSCHTNAAMAAADLRARVPPGTPLNNREQRRRAEARARRKG